MTYTAVNTNTSNSIIYLPVNPGVNYGGILNNTWSTSTSNWTQSSLIFDENGSKIVDQISSLQLFITKYKNLVNGIIYAELVDRLNELLNEVSCLWGIGNFVGFSNTYSWTAPTQTWVQPAATTTWGQYTVSGNTTGSSWTTIDNSAIAAYTYYTY